VVAGGYAAGGRSGERHQRRVDGVGGELASHPPRVRVAGRGHRRGARPGVAPDRVGRQTGWGARPGAGPGRVRRQAGRGARPGAARGARAVNRAARVAIRWPPARPGRAASPRLG